MGNQFAGSQTLQQARAAKDTQNGYTYGFMDKTGVYIYLEVLSGFALDEAKAAGNRHSFILPLREDSFVTPTDQQEFFAPIEELFKDVSAVIGGLGANWISGVADMVVKFQDLFGTRLFNSDLHAQAWRQARPSSLSLKLDFNYGMLNEWNAKTEVMQPLLILKRCSIPRSEAGAFHAPGPTAISVYKEFGSSVFDSAITAVSNIVKTASGGVVDKAVTTATKTLSATGTNLLKDATSSSLGSSSKGLWALTFIAFNAKTNAQQILYQSPRLVCKESTISFGNQLDDTLCPISGSATLSLSSQAPSDSQSFKHDDLWKK